MTIRLDEERVLGWLKERTNKWFGVGMVNRSLKMPIDIARELLNSLADKKEIIREVRTIKRGIYSRYRFYAPTKRMSELAIEISESSLVDYISNSSFKDITYTIVARRFKCKYAKAREVLDNIYQGGSLPPNHFKKISNGYRVIVSARYAMAKLDNATGKKITKRVVKKSTYKGVAATSREFRKDTVYNPSSAIFARGNYVRL